MNGLTRALLTILALLGTAVLAPAQTIITIDFDDLIAGSNPAEQYAGLGVHFSSGDNGVQVGLTNGDPGNWGLDGTAAPYFLGFNGAPGYGDTISFDTPTTAVTLDVARSSGSQPTDTFTLTAFAGATQVDTTTVTLANATLNIWQTVTVAGAGITSIQLSSTGGFHPYGIDNIRIGFNPIPEPPVVMLMGIGLAGLAWMRRRR